MNQLVQEIKQNSKVKFDWMSVLQLLIAERINEPASKRQSYFNQNEYLGFGKDIKLEHFYRSLDLLSKHQDIIKKHLFTQQQNLFTQKLDVVFYDVTTLYFDSQKQDQDNLRQKGYSKDGKSHKTQVVLGLLVDKFRNPITYQIYQGNTYEGKTMIDALQTIQKKYQIDQVIAVADSGMIDKANRDYMHSNQIDYIIGNSIKSLPENIKVKLLDKSQHKSVRDHISIDTFSYTSITHAGRKIICTYSAKRARKDKSEREKLINKAKKWLDKPSQYKQVTKRGAGKFISHDDKNESISLNTDAIEKDSRYDGFKAIATTADDLSINEILEKYSDLFEVEHAFRALKSQLEIRPVFHWTNKRIEGHIVMCFMAYTFLNYLRNITNLQYREIVKSLDKMQMSVIKEDNSDELLYMRSNLSKNEMQIVDTLKMVVPKNITPQKTVYQMFE